MRLWNLPKLYPNQFGKKLSIGWIGREQTRHSITVNHMVTLKSGSRSPKSIWHKNKTIVSLTLLTFDSSAEDAGYFVRTDWNEASIVYNVQTSYLFPNQPLFSKPLYWSFYIINIHKIYFCLEKSLKYDKKSDIHQAVNK